MISINVIGKGVIDVGDIQFTRQNQLLRFSDISLDRSTEFFIPATQENRRTFDYPEDVFGYGERMRRSYDAEMVFDGGVLSGVLELRSLEDGRFRCVFYLDATMGLQAVFGRKLADCACSFPGVRWDSRDTVTRADAANPSDKVCVIGYESSLPAGAPVQLTPSVNVKKFCEDVLAGLGLSWSIDIDEDLWMVAASMNGGATDTVTFTQTATDNASLTQTGTYFEVVDIDLEWASGSLFGVLTGGGTTAAKAFRATRDVEVAFPSTFPVNVYLVKWDSSLRNCITLGGVNAVGRGDPHTGTPGESTALAGRTVRFRKGGIYFFAGNKWFVLEGRDQWYGYKENKHPFSTTCTVTLSGDLENGGTWQVQNNMPDTTVFDFLRSVALATSCELTVRSDSGYDVSISPIGDVRWGIRDVGRVVKTSKVSRTVPAWGENTRTARVLFDSEDYVTDPIVTDYPIDNEQIDGLDEHKAFFSEGTQGTDGVLIADRDQASPYKFIARRWTLAKAGASAGAVMQRVVAPSLGIYSDMGTTATCVRLDVLMGEGDFLTLRDRDTFTHAGALWVWTDAQWSDGVASMTLQKAAAPMEIDIEPPAPLPYDAEVEYLQSTGTQYMNLGFAIDESDTIIIDAMFNAKSNDNFLLGARSGTGGSVWIDVNGTNYYVRFGSSSSSNVGTGGINVRHSFELRKQYFAVDGVLLRQPGYASMPSKTLALFARHSATFDKGNVRIYSALIKDGNNDARIDLIPVRVGTTGYLYDRVSGNLFGNDGTGNFTVGPDVN